VNDRFGPLIAFKEWKRAKACWQQMTPLGICARIRARIFPNEGREALRQGAESRKSQFLKTPFSGRMR